MAENTRIKRNRDLLMESRTSLAGIDLRSIPKDLRDEVKDLRTRTATVHARLTEEIATR